MRATRAIAGPLAIVLAAASAPLAAQTDVGKTVSIMGPPAPERRQPSRFPIYPDDTPEQFATADPNKPIAEFSTALQQAYWTNPDLLAGRARLRSTDFRLPQARAAYGPRLSYQASYGWQRENQEQLFGGYAEAKAWSLVGSAILTQPLYTFGRSLADERAAISQIDFERARLKFGENQVLFDAITAYVGVVRDREGIRIAQDNLDLLTRELADTRTRFRLREVTSTDLQQVETRYEFGQAQILGAKRAAATSEARFLGTIGAPAGALPQPNPLAMPVTTIEEAYALAETQSPIVAAAYARELVSRAQRDSARADMMPRVDLRGRADVGSSALGSNTLRQTNLRTEVVVSGPIFESGIRRARIGEAEAANDSDWRLIDAALRDSKSEVADAWNEWKSQSAAEFHLKASIAAAEAAYDGALAQERAGLRTTLDVLDLARDLLSARTSHNAAAANAYLAQARLLVAMGSLDTSYLFPGEPRYDHLRHFEKVKDNSDIPLLTTIVRAIDNPYFVKFDPRAPRDPSARVGSAGVETGPETEEPPATPAPR
jgi:TolC family type I secretion outer membrane protein